MPVDDGAELPHSAFVGLAEAVDSALDGRPRAWLAEQLGVDAATVSRLLGGHTREVRVDQVVALEKALSAPRGYLFRAMGLIEEARTFEEWLAAQPRLTPQVRRALLGAYQAATAP